MSTVTPAVTGAVLAALVALGAVAGMPVLVAVLVLIVVGVAAGWPGLLSLPTQRGSTSIVALCGACAVGVVAMTTTEPVLRWLPAVLALSVIVAFWHQLLRRDRRPRLTESVTGVVSGVVVVVFAAGWAGALRAPAEADLVLVGAAATLLASLASALPGPRALAAVAGVVLGAAAAFGAASLLPGIEAAHGALLGAGAGLVVVALHLLLAHLPTAAGRQTGMTIGAAGVACAGPVVYLLSRVVVG